MDRPCGAGSAAGKRRPGSAARIGIAGNDAGTCGFELRDLLPDVVALAEADERAHARILCARVADLGLRQPLAESLFDGVQILGRRHGAADGRAFLPCLHRHLGRDFLDEEIELRRSGPGVGPKQGGIEAVLLRDEADGLPHYDGVRPKLERGVGGPREADDVLAGQMVEQVADSADDKLDRASAVKCSLRSSP